MPEIPPFVSTEGYGFTPDQQTNVGADSASGQALERGGQAITSDVEALGSRANLILANMRAHQAQNQSMIDAAGKESDAQVWLSQRMQDYAKDPDYATAPSRLAMEAQQYAQGRLVDGIDNPNTKAQVLTNFTRSAGNSVIALGQQSFVRGNAAQVSQLNAGIDQRLGPMASSDPGTFDNNLAMTSASLKGAVAGGLMTQAQADAKMSATIRAGLTLRAANDPVGAQALLQKYQPMMSEQDQVGMTEHLKPLLQDKQAVAQGQTMVGLAGGNAAPGPVAPGAISPEQRADIVTQGVAGTPIPPQLLAAQIQQESGWVPGAKGGAGEIGLMQIKPGTAQAPGFGMSAADPNGLQDAAANAKWGAQYLYARGKAAGMQDSDWQDPSKWGIALKAYNGGGDPNYVANVLRNVPGSGAPGGMVIDPNDPKAMAYANSIEDPDQRMRAISKFRQIANVNNAGYAQQRAAMDDRVSNVTQILMSGLDAPAPGESEVRRLFPGAEGDKLISQLSDAQTFGAYRKGIDLATPEQIQQDMQDLANGTGMVARGGKTGAPLGPVTLPDGTPNVDGFRERAKQQQMFQAAYAARQKDLTADPASYVTNRDPAVQQAYAAVQANPQDAAAFENYATMSAASQKRLGVADQDVRVLGKPQAQRIAGTLVNADPSKTDTGATLDAMAQSYGGAWPGVWHDLVRDGGLPDTFQVLGQMQPGPDRITMQRALQAAQSKGGIEGMRKDIQPADSLLINKGIDNDVNFAAFAKTAMIPGVASNPGLVTAVRNAIQASALFRAMGGTDAGAALTQAAASALPYDFVGMARAPKGQGDQAEATGARVLQAMKPEDLAVPAAGVPMLAGDKQADYLTRLQRSGQWVTNERGDGWALVARNNDGSYQFPLRADGTRVGFKFADMTPDALAHSPGDDLMRGNVAP